MARRLEGAMSEELFDHIDKLKSAEPRVAVATLVNTRGTTPRKEGAKMVVGEGGRILGSVTIGGCVDAQVIEESASVLGDNAPRLLELKLGDEKARAHAETGRRAAVITRLDASARGSGKLLVRDDGVREGSLGDDFLDQRFAAEAEESLRAGKSRTLFLEGIRAFVEVFAPPAILCLVGAGHVAMPLVTLARALSFRTIVIDGRPRFATRERFPDVDDLKIGIPSELVRGVPMIATTALVLVAHDYKYDVPVLKHALSTPVGYIGLLGSTRRGAAILNLLREDGVAEDLLPRVRVPIGLDLGAQSAPEIALSIMAEVLAVQRGASGMAISEKVRRGIR